MTKGSRRHRAHRPGRPMCRIDAITRPRSPSHTVTRDSPDLGVETSA